MKKTIGLITMLIIMLITLTGCAQINYEVKVNKDGSGEIAYTYGISKDVLQQLNISAEDVISSMKEQAEESAYTVEAYENDNISGFKANKHVKDLSKDFSLQEAFGEEYVKDTENNGIKIEKGFLIVRYSQNTQIDLTTMNESEETIEMTYKIKLPAKVKTSNANEISKNQKELTWNLTAGKMNKIEFVAEEINMLSIAIILVIVVVIIAAIVIIIKLKKKHVTKKEN